MTKRNTGIVSPLYLYFLVWRCYSKMNLVLMLNQYIQNEGQPYIYV